MFEDSVIWPDRRPNLGRGSAGACAGGEIPDDPGRLAEWSSRRPEAQLSADRISGDAEPVTPAEPVGLAIGLLLGALGGGYRETSYRCSELSSMVVRWARIWWASGMPRSV